jgi:hypothetical protein
VFVLSECFDLRSILLNAFRMPKIKEVGEYLGRVFDTIKSEEAPSKE